MHSELKYDVWKLDLHIKHAKVNFIYTLKFKMFDKFRFAHYNMQKLILFIH
jgi:hypothetical protein